MIPREAAPLLVKRGIFTLEETRTRLAMLCRPCHSACHRAASTTELGTTYNTVEALLELEEVRRFARASLTPCRSASSQPMRVGKSQAAASLGFGILDEMTGDAGFCNVQTRSCDWTAL